MLLALAGALGIAWAVFRSSSEQKLRDIDRQLLTSQEMLINQQEAEVARLKVECAREKQAADQYRADLTQKAAVDHLLEVVVGEEKRRAEEHKRAAEASEMHTLLLKDIVAQLKGHRGTLG